MPQLHCCKTGLKAFWDLTVSTPDGGEKHVFVHSVSVLCIALKELGVEATASSLYDLIKRRKEIGAVSRRRVKHLLDAGVVEIRQIKTELRLLENLPPL